MAYLYPNALDKLLSCYFVFKQRFPCVPKMFEAFQSGFLLLKDQVFCCY